METIFTPETLGTLSGVLILCGFVPYCTGILGWVGQKRIIPPILAWIIWLATDTVQAFSASQSNAEYWIPLGAGIGSFVVIVIAIRKKAYTLLWDWYNIATLVLAIVAILVWIALDAKTGKIINHSSQVLASF